MAKSKILHKYFLWNKWVGKIPELTDFINYENRVSIIKGNKPIEEVYTNIALYYKALNQLVKHQQLLIIQEEQKLQVIEGDIATKKTDKNITSDVLSFFKDQICVLEEYCHREEQYKKYGMLVEYLEVKENSPAKLVTITNIFKNFHKIGFIPPLHEINNVSFFALASDISLLNNNENHITSEFRVEIEDYFRTIYSLSINPKYKDKLSNWGIDFTKHCETIDHYHFVYYSSDSDSEYDSESNNDAPGHITLECMALVPHENTFSE